MALTQQRAQQRSKHIEKGSIHYDFHISLQIGTHYNGLSELNFSLLSVPEELHVDFKGTDIKKLFINSESSEVQTEDGFIKLDTTKLKQGSNHVAVMYRNKYDNDGSGCCSFTDVDGKQYLYTQFESYFANRVLALFDQPDLKAKMRLNVISPKTWKKILSNEYATVEKQFDAKEFVENARTQCKGLLQEFLNDKNGTNMTLFPDTKLLPTYLYCFIAGEYEELKIEQPYNNIPMSLYCIESLYKYMKEMAPFVFEITIESLKFFEEFFGYKFAFNKYDQVFAHEYKWGAMENAGIVTHNDIYIFKEKVSTERMLDFANTISHELAHHWFGNLVTMEWWDDVWLNESFADYISYLCLEKIKQNCKTINYESAMASFLTRKGWGYHEDQMITTHPIRGPVPNTSVADSIFDGITYSKGASTMKQLNFLMTEAKFSAALKEYFHKYEWRNASLADFIDIMQKHFELKDFTLNEWRSLWLEQASLNKIEAVWSPEDKSEQAELRILQSPVNDDYKTLRMHRIKVGLFKENGEIDVLETLVRPQAETITHFNGSNSYKALLLNYEDHTFVKNVIDKASLQYFSQNLNTINDILSRTLIWKSFYEMVKDADMKGSQYVDIVIQFIAKEPSDSIFENQFNYVHAAINTYTPKSYRSELNQKIFLFILELLTNENTSALQENRVIILKKKLVQFAKSEESKTTILNWMEDKEDNLLVKNKHEMTVGLKWSTVCKAFTLKHLSLEEKEKIFAKQKEADPSDTAKNKRYLCDGLIASKEEFEKIYLRFQDKDSDLSITVKEELAAGWNHQMHEEWLLEYRDRYFADIEKVSKVLNGDHFEMFYEGLQPIDDDLEYHIKKYGAIKLQPVKLDKNSRDLQKIVDNLKRRVKAYALYNK